MKKYLLPAACLVSALLGGIVITVVAVLGSADQHAALVKAGIAWGYVWLGLSLIAFFVVMTTRSSDEV